MSGDATYTCSYEQLLNVFGAPGIPNEVLVAREGRKPMPPMGPVIRRKDGGAVSEMCESITERAEAITSYAALPCATCTHPSSHHSDIGTCEVCDCESFEED